MNKVVALGFFIVFIIPSVIGFIVAKNVNLAAGIITGIIIFVVIIGAGYRHMINESKK